MVLEANSATLIYLVLQWADGSRSNDKGRQRRWSERCKGEH
jgi:hypothetical protein